MNLRNALAATLWVPLLAWAQQALPPQPTTQLTAGIHLITAEVVADSASMMRGLMFRERMDTNHGMAFVYPEKTSVCMWMRNTLLPLSVAFIDDDGAIVNIEDMAPLTETTHCARKQVRYALEMNLGWFAQRGIKPGAKITGLPKNF
jgi:uncharacterized protein